MRILLTVILGVIILLVCRLDPKVPQAGSDWFWRGGRNDLFRVMFFRNDGVFRSGSKPVLLIWLVIGEALVWMIP